MPIGVGVVAISVAPTNSTKPFAVSLLSSNALRLFEVIIQLFKPLVILIHVEARTIKPNPDAKIFANIPNSFEARVAAAILNESQIAKILPTKLSASPILFELHKLHT
jgi:hypothetical protein